MNTLEMAAELRDVQAKIQAIKTGKFPLPNSKAKRLETLLDREEELYEDLGPEWLEKQVGWAR